jgi:hypothetical protein
VWGQIRKFRYAVAVRKQSFEEKKNQFLAEETSENTKK